MSKKIVFAILSIIILSSGLYLWVSHSDTRTVVAKTMPPVTAYSGPITLAMVASHNTQTSCWTVIDGGVYDLTGWIPNHPGGERAILSLCGHDGSGAFHGQHDDAKRQADILATFKIGTITQ